MTWKCDNTKTIATNYSNLCMKSDKGLTNKQMCQVLCLDKLSSKVLPLRAPTNNNYYHRLKDYVAIRTILRKYDPMENNCINAYLPEYNNIKEVTVLDYISAGVNGEVYQAIGGDIRIALKKQPLTPGLESEYKFILSQDYYTEGWGEIYGMIFLNTLFLKQISPHVNLLYKYFVCDYCKYLEEERGGKIITNKKYQISSLQKSSCILILNELADGTFSSWLQKRHQVKSYFIVLFQIFYTLLAIQYEFGIIHSDCHSENILYSKTHNKSGSYYQYSIFDKEIVVSDINYIFKIYDVAKMASPELNHKVYSKMLEEDAIEQINKDFKRIINDFFNTDILKQEIICPDDKGPGDQITVETIFGIKQVTIPDALSFSLSNSSIVLVRDKRNRGLVKRGTIMAKSKSKNKNKKYKILYDDQKLEMNVSANRFSSVETLQPGSTFQVGLQAIDNVPEEVSQFLYKYQKLFNRDKTGKTRLTVIYELMDLIAELDIPSEKIINSYGINEQKYYLDVASHSAIKEAITNAAEQEQEQEQEPEPEQEPEQNNSASEISDDLMILVQEGIITMDQASEMS